MVNVDRKTIIEIIDNIKLGNDNYRSRLVTEQNIKEIMRLFKGEYAEDDVYGDIEEYFLENLLLEIL